MGEPNDIVKKVPTTNDNFKLTWDNLCSRFENKTIVINIQLKKLLGPTHVANESTAGLKSLQRDINSCISLLQLYGIDVESWNPLFIFIYSNCLPNGTLTLWEQTLKNKTTIPEWSKLDEFITNCHRTLESVSEIRKSADIGEPISRMKSSKTGNKTNVSNIRAFQSKVSEPKCHLCPKEAHTIRKCPRFMRHNTLLHREYSKPQISTAPNSTTKLNPNSALFPSSSKSIQSTDLSRNDVLDISPEDLLCEDFLNFEDRSTAKALGIRWNAMSDTFFFSMEPFPKSNTFTKREVLSQIAKLFDPAGWLSP